MTTLKIGQRIPLSNGESGKILSFIAEGGQGEVYKVEYNGKVYALKWYSKIKLGDVFYDNLQSNIKSGSPGESFLWPIASTQKLGGTFGYIMPFCSAEYKQYGKFITGDVRFKSWELLINSALDIAQSFYDLHSDGFSYQDLNEGSFFMNPDTGKVLICDNDNVAPFGVNLGVKGTPKYMSPEVVTNRCRPNTHTDRFSLAIILFRLFYIDHPLEGKYTIQFPLTDNSGAELFGKNPVFIYDPKNDINRPDPYAHSNVVKRWNMFPPDLKSAFIRSFTDGLRDINSRLTEHQWIDILVRTRSMLVRLNDKERFVNAYSPRTLPNGCMLIRLENNLAVLAPGSKLYPCQTERASLDHSNPSALVGRSKVKNDVYGLCNCTDKTWKVTMPNGTVKTFPPKSYTELKHGMIIDFGTLSGKVY